MPKKTTVNKSFVNIQKQVADGGKVIIPLLDILKRKIKDKELLDDNKQVFGEKDSLLSAYIRLSQVQIKWVEVSLALEKEQARQREWLVKNTPDIKTKDDEQRELSAEEWEMLEAVVEQRSRRHSAKDPEINSG